MDDVQESYNYFNKQICLVGHTHRPFIISRNDKGNCLISQKTEEKIYDNRKYLINIGSIGQPRDNDPKSCYAIYDTDSKTIRLKRVAYDLNETQKQMADLGLPEYLIERLAVGR